MNSRLMAGCVPLIIAGGMLAGMMSYALASNTAVVFTAGHAPSVVTVATYCEPTFSVNQETLTPDATTTATASVTATPIDEATPTPLPGTEPTQTPTEALTPVQLPTETETLIPSPTATWTPVPSKTATPTPSLTFIWPSDTPTPEPTAFVTAIVTRVVTRVVVVTATPDRASVCLPIRGRVYVPFVLRARR